VPILNGQQAAPAPFQIAVNCGQIAPGVFRFAMSAGPIAIQFDLGLDMAEALFRKALAEVDASRSKIVVAPSGSLPSS
jgi:hypothetical protein